LSSFEHRGVGAGAPNVLKSLKFAGFASLK
jgi:hypothetical protein